MVSGAPLIPGGSPGLTAGGTYRCPMKRFPDSIAGSTCSLWSAAGIPDADQLTNIPRAGARYRDSGQRASYIGTSIARFVVNEADDSNPDFRCHSLWPMASRSPGTGSRRATVCPGIVMGGGSMEDELHGASKDIHVFTVDSGQCFRMVFRRGSAHAMLCPRPVKIRGRIQSGHGRWHEVESCMDHAADLVDCQILDGALPPDPFGSDRRRTHSDQ